MSKGGRNRGQKNFIPNKKQLAQKQVIANPVAKQSVLDKMIDGREFESLLAHRFTNVNILEEIRRSIAEIKAVRGNEIVCYVANVVKQTKVSVSIDYQDDLPFTELINTLPTETKELDVVLVSPGGLSNQVVKFVSKLRPRFERVNFILLNMAMSAGTIFALSGDEIIMTHSANIGPIDPQIRKPDGQFVPAQSILNLVEEIKERGDKSLKAGTNPSWTDLTLLKNIDPKEIGYAISGTKYSETLVEDYLYNYKFKTWTKHSSNGNVVTDEEKRKRSKDIAKLLANHSEWNNHGHAITREDAWDVCQLKITHAESIGLDKSMRRMWALFYWAFENTSMAKIFVSDYYCLIRNDIQTNNTAK